MWSYTVNLRNVSCSNCTWHSNLNPLGGATRRYMAATNPQVYRVTCISGRRSCVLEYSNVFTPASYNNLSLASFHSDGWWRCAPKRRSQLWFETPPRAASGRHDEWDEDTMSGMKTGWVGWRQFAMETFLSATTRDWPRPGETWRDNWWGSAAGWGRWTNTDLRNASSGWRTASVWRHCAWGCPSVRAARPSCGSASAGKRPRRQNR